MNKIIFCYCFFFPVSHRFNYLGVKGSYKQLEHHRSLSLFVHFQVWCISKDEVSDKPVCSLFYRIICQVSIMRYFFASQFCACFGGMFELHATLL